MQTVYESGSKLNKPVLCVGTISQWAFTNFDCDGLCFKYLIIIIDYRI